MCWILKKKLTEYFYPTRHKKGTHFIHYVFCIHDTMCKWNFKINSKGQLKSCTKSFLYFDDLIGLEHKNGKYKKWSKVSWKRNTEVEGFIMLKSKWVVQSWVLWRDFKFYWDFVMFWVMMTLWWPYKDIYEKKDGKENPHTE